MTQNLIVYINGIRRLEFDRAQGLPGVQRRLLDEMDGEMDQGIQLDEGRVESPDDQQKTRYIMQHMLNALTQDQENAAAVFCTWLGVRQPDLVAVRVVDQGGEFSAKLQFA